MKCEAKLVKIIYKIKLKISVFFKLFHEKVKKKILKLLKCKQKIQHINKIIQGYITGSYIRGVT